MLNSWEFRSEIRASSRCGEGEALFKDTGRQASRHRRMKRRWLTVTEWWLGQGQENPSDTVRCVLQPGDVRWWKRAWTEKLDWLSFICLYSMFNNITRVWFIAESNKYQTQYNTPSGGRGPSLLPALSLGVPYSKISRPALASTSAST